MTQRISTDRLLELSREPNITTMIEVIWLIDEVASRRLNEGAVKVLDTEFHPLDHENQK